MNFVMVREDLLPYVNKASLVMAEELMKIDSNYDRGEAMLSVALGIINHLINDDPELACVVARRLVEGTPSKNESLQMARSTVLTPEFADILFRSHDETLAQLFPTPPRKH